MTSTAATSGYTTSTSLHAFVKQVPVSLRVFTFFGARVDKFSSERAYERHVSDCGEELDVSVLHGSGAIVDVCQRLCERECCLDLSVTKSNNRHCPCF